MAIYTRFGTPVTVVSGDIIKGHIDTLGSGSQPEVVHEGYISDYVADGGINEIAEAIDTANCNRAYREGKQ